MQRLLITAVLFCIAQVCNSQPAAGTTGLLNSPSAEMPDDGTFSAGLNYLPDIVTYQPQFSYPTFNYYAGMAFLPFMELSFRMIILKERNNELLNNQDRSVALRIRLMKERKYLPAIVAGGNDIYTTSTSGNQYFRSFYVAATKNFKSGGNRASFTLGYNHGWVDNSDLSPVFGGATFSPSFFRPLTVLAEYDSHIVNAGASVLLFRYLFIYAYAANMSQLAGGISFRLYAHGGSRDMIGTPALE
jgi:hypothetical protein